MAGVEVKQEINEVLNDINTKYTKNNGVSDTPVIDLDSSSDDDASCSNGDGINSGKRSRVLPSGGCGDDGDEDNCNKRKKKSVSSSSADGVNLPAGFLEPLPPPSKDAAAAAALRNQKENRGLSDRSGKQFWKAGDFEVTSGGNWDASSGGMDHLRVHPRFLHSNATSHKWVLGAFAELLDNALDEICNGASYCKIDMLRNKKDGNRMLLIEDNGGGMDPEKLRHCMSLGYSLKSKVKDAIGQYGNGFKTSTMRLGADVIVFTRCSGKQGKRPTQSIGLLSYTFLRSTGKEDIVVPMLDYEKSEREWKKMKRASTTDWEINVEAIVEWSPFSSEADLLKQFDHVKEHGTRIIIYNLWEDDQGQLELDFDTDKHDIQIRGVNRDEKNIEMAQLYPNSRHFLTYRHSLRSYASILYLRVPHSFRMILRGKDVEHHNIVNDMMITNEVTYRPQPGLEGIPKDSNMVAMVTIGFVKDAKAHIDVQGFNVYHKNRLIKPFWRLWNAAGSDGRGVIGVLEANFVEPAHDKQGFERTNVLQRLESRLVQMQKDYWNKHCHKIGYAPRRRGKNLEDREASPDYTTDTETPSLKKHSASERNTPFQRSTDRFSSYKHDESIRHPSTPVNANNEGNIGDKSHNRTPTVIGASSSESATHLSANFRDNNDSEATMSAKHTNGNGTSFQKEISSAQKRDKFRSVSAAEQHDCSPSGKTMQVVTHSRSPFPGVNGNETVPSNYNKNTSIYSQLIVENLELKERLRRREEDIFGSIVHDLECERNRCKELESQIEEEKQKFDALSREQESILAIFTEERECKKAEEQALRKKLKEAEATMKNLLEKVTQLQLEKMKTQGNKWGQH